MMSHKLLLPLTLLTAGLATSLSASSITIVNPGFESDVLSCPPSGTCGINQAITGWTGSTADPNGFADGYNAAGTFGVYKPSSVQYPGGIPGGLNVAYVTGTTYSASISQVLGATLLANDTYTTTVDIGQRVDLTGHAAGCNGLSAALEAGGVVLASTDPFTQSCNLIEPAGNPIGSFVQVSFSYNSGASPAQLGAPLEIVLTSFGSGSQNNQGEVDFDNVTLSDTRSSGSPTPEPASIVLIGSGLIALAAVRARRPRSR
jgi:hypothetical protein